MEDRFKNWVKPIIEHMKPNKYGWIVSHPDKLQLGDRTDIGAFTFIAANHGIVIEDEVQIGSHCSIYSISTIDNKKGTVTLRKNSRIGTHSTVMPGVTVGENSIIGAHSFVNKDIPANVFAFGVPAKVIKKLES